MKAKLYVRIDAETQGMYLCLEDGTPIDGEYMVRVTDIAYAMLAVRASQITIK